MELLQLELSPFNSSALCVPDAPGSHMQELQEAWKRMWEVPLFTGITVWQGFVKTPPPGWCPWTAWANTPLLNCRPSHLSWDSRHFLHPTPYLVGRIWAFSASPTAPAQAKHTANAENKYTNKCKIFSSSVFFQGRNASQKRIKQNPNALVGCIASVA